MGVGKLFLGIDVGSVSTNLVVADAAGKSMSGCTCPPPDGRWRRCGWASLNWQRSLTTPTSARAA